MASSKEAARIEANAENEAAKAKGEPKFTLEALQKHCLELFGVSTTTFVGAATGIEAKEYTVKEMKSIIEAWCRKAVR